jgi:hypothetical protein
MRAFAPYVAALALGLASVGFLSESPRNPPASTDGPLLPRPELLRILGAGNLALVSDYYWLLTTYQIGRAATAEQYRDVYFYADLCTDLDPKFFHAYRYGALSTTFNYGRERWVNMDESSALLRKGLTHFPGNYELRFLLAYNLMFLHRDYPQACTLLTELMREPEAAPWISQIATRVCTQGGKFDEGLALATAMRDGAKDEETRQFFQRRILEITLEKILLRVDAAAKAFADQNGRPPKDIPELVEGKFLPGYPFDPLGGTIYLGIQGRAYSTANRYRMELIEEFKKAEGLQ